ncbi:RNA polymerase sigma factor, partial [Streptomyces fuscigenes]|uniref:RNA polymerase sigma factor n=1 Tax=Streptomyces fuscigenes TaxID=1528880 RepID=UPI001F3B3847
MTTASSSAPPAPLRGGFAALTLHSFITHHDRLWLRYAHTRTGSERAARAIVEATCARIAADWPRIREEGSLPGRARALLADETGRWLRRHGRPPVPAAAAASRAAVRALLLHETRGALAALEGETGLYGAIAALPGRQYDVMVLRYVLRAPDEEVAAYLGIEPATVRSHVRHARRRLARVLGIPETARRGA